MKGIIFTEFMGLVEQNWGMDMVDDLIEAVNPPSGGAYTSVATYDSQELMGYVKELHSRTGIEVKNLVHTFGIFLAASFVDKFPDFFSQSKSTFDVLKQVDNHIHVEVRKLYPDAELPKFSYEELGPNKLLLKYESVRALADLAHGLIEGCARQFGESIDVRREASVVDGVAHEDFFLTLS